MLIEIDGSNSNREEIYRWMGGQKTPIKMLDDMDGVDVVALADAMRNDDVAAEQLRIGSGCVDSHSTYELLVRGDD
jgi:uncharacterized protein YpmB|eukprot:COSAG02_NODE_3887_length_6085_cov_3.846809_6_plen_76_part_00